MATVQLLSGAIPGAYAPKNIIESIQYSNIEEEWLTGRVRITDFGESFFINNPPIGLLRTPVPYFAPEMFFGRTASAASDIWALGCLIFELQASRPMICAFFGTHDEALAEIAQALGPLPKVWRNSYFDKHRKIWFKTGEKDPWFDLSNSRHSLELMISNIKPRLTAKEATDFLALLKAILKYEPSDRLSAKQIAMHPWFAK
jgi:serine/threonine protein kinase